MIFIILINYIFKIDKFITYHKVLIKKNTLYENKLFILILKNFFPIYLVIKIFFINYFIND